MTDTTLNDTAPDRRDARGEPARPGHPHPRRRRPPAAPASTAPLPTSAGNERRRAERRRVAGAGPDAPPAPTQDSAPADGGQTSLAAPRG